MLHLSNGPTLLNLRLPLLKLRAIHSPNPGLRKSLISGGTSAWKSKKSEKSKVSNRLTFEFAVKVRKSTIRELQASRQSSWRALASTATRIIERPARRDGERLRGKIAFAELPNGIDDRWLANPTPCGTRKNKDQPFRSHNAESRTEHPAFAKQSSLVDETGIEPATSSLRTMGKIS